MAVRNAMTIVRALPAMSTASTSALGALSGLAVSDVAMCKMCTKQARAYRATPGGYNEPALAEPVVAPVASVPLNIVVTPSPAAYARPSDSEVVSLFESWNSALATLDPVRVADCYAPSAVLLPTVSNQYRRTRDEIIDYFTAFLKMRPQGVLDQYEIRHLADGVVQNLGIYTFTLGGADNKQVQARYSFTYVRQPSGRWLIAEHHSSAMPENVTQQVMDAFTRWNSALQTGNPQEVASCYAPSAVLLPTVSNIVRNTPDKIADYFSAFLQRKPKGTIEHVEGSTPNVRFLAPNVAINSGTYKFNLTNPETGTTADVRARYTYVYKKHGSEWLIEEHHSSVMPEPEPAAA